MQTPAITHKFSIATVSGCLIPFFYFITKNNKKK